VSACYRSPALTNPGQVHNGVGDGVARRQTHPAGVVSAKQPAPVSITQLQTKWAADGRFCGIGTFPRPPPAGPPGWGVRQTGLFGLGRQTGLSVPQLEAESGRRGSGPGVRSLAWTRPDPTRPDPLQPQPPHPHASHAEVG